MLEIRSSRSGHLTAFHDGVALHSAYDPPREAARFVEAATGPEAPGTLIVLGEILGHLSRAARSLYPATHVIAVYYTTELWRRSPEAAHGSWHPASPLTLRQFLRRALEELDVEGLRAVEWPAARAAFPEQSRQALEAIAQVTRELNGSVTTTVRSGRLWLRNALRNFLYGPDPLAAIPVPPERPVLIAASGPSLEDAGPTIERVRGGVSLWALPSAVDHLLARGIEPDLVVLTDPAYYSVYHIHAAAGLELPVAMPLSASPGVWRVSSRVAYLGQGTFYETALLASLGGGAAAVSPHGTVAGTAMELALRASGPGLVVLAGLDLCYRDVLSHCRPNAFEHFLLGGEGRLSPFHHRSFAGAVEAAPERIRGTRARTSLPLRTYAGWFAALPSDWSARLRRLAGSPVELPAIPEISPGEIEAIRSDRADRAHLAAGPEERRHAGTRDRSEVVSRLLQSWRAGLRSSSDAPQGIALELARLLALRDLIDVKRRARRGDLAGARDTWARIVDDLDSFLRSQEELTRAGADA